MHELRELWAELWSARRRLLPVVLGLLWGTVGLSLLIAFGDGFRTAMHGALAQSGEDMLRFGGGATARTFAGLPPGRVIRLQPEHAEVVARVAGVRAVSPEYLANVRLVADVGTSQNVTVSGCAAEYLTIRGINWRCGGRFLSPVDVLERRRVVFVGYALADALYGRRDVVGQTLRLWDTPFTIVGVMATRTTLMNYSGDDNMKAFVPWTVLRAMRGPRQLSCLLAQTDATTAAAGRAREAAVRRALGERLRFDPNDLAAVWCANNVTTASQISDIIAGTRWFLFIVGVLGLLVAALGVANMMFAMVEERVHEIGLRMALGATPMQIRRRQLVETACVVGIGGGLGLLLAALLLFVANRLPVPPDAKLYLGEPLLSIATCVTIAGLLGLAAGVAGWHPAARAAAVQPVEALHHE